MAPSQDGGSAQGRALLSCAVNAITEGRFDDLSFLLQSHTQELHTARHRLEKKYATKHGSADGVFEAESSPAAPLQGGSLNEAAKATSPPGSGGRVRNLAPAVFGTLQRWADSHPLLSIVLVQLFVVVAYAPGLFYSELLMDDTVGIMRNPNVVGEEVSLQSYMERDYWGLPMHGSGWTNKSFRPLTTWTFRWNYLLHGLGNSGFHISNVILHCMASAVVGHTALVALGLPGSWAALSALFFGLHPVHTENVLYLVGRADILAAILGMLSMSAYAWCFCPPAPASDGGRSSKSMRLGSEDLRWLLTIAAPSLLIVASGLCKETGFMFFAMAAGLEMLNFFCISAREQVGFKLHAKRWYRLRVRWVVLALTAVFVFICRYRHTGGTKLNMSPQDNPISFESSALVRILSYFYLHGVYGRLLCWPQFLCYDYSMDAIPAVRTLMDCRLLLPLAAYAGLFGALSAVFTLHPQQRRAGLVSLALMVLQFLPASNIFFPVGTVIGERLLYMPSAGFCLAVIVWLRSGLEGRTRKLAGGAAKEQLSAPKANGGRGRAREEQPRSSNSMARKSSNPVVQAAPPRWTGSSAKVCKVLCFGVLAVLGVRTLLRVRVWESSETLFISDGQRQTKSSKVQFNLGITYMQAQEWDKAVEALIRCAWADPLSALPFFRIGQIEILRGRFETAETWLAAAIDKFGASLMVRDEEVFHDLAVAMFQNGKVEGAERRLRIALRLNEEFAKGWNNLACCIAERDMQQAMRAVRRATTIEPENPQYWANLALLAQHAGDWNTASAAWRQAVSIFPEMPEPRDCTWEFAPS